MEQAAPQPVRGLEVYMCMCVYMRIYPIGILVFARHYAFVAPSPRPMLTARTSSPHTAAGGLFLASRSHHPRPRSHSHPSFPCIT